MPSPAQRSALEAVKYLSGLPFRRRMREAETWSSERFWQHQASALEHRYRTAKERVPFYRDDDRYPAALDTSAGALQALASLPVLSKAEVRRNSGRLERRPHGILTATHTTGGTTGTPMRVRAGLFERGATNAILERRYAGIAGRRNPRIVRLSGYLTGGENSLWLKVPGARVAYLSIYQLGPQRRTEVIELMRAFRPEALHGYASALTQLARLVDGEDIGCDDLAVVSTSETLDSGQRQVIEAGLRARVFNEYGSQEGQHLVLECSHHRMHIHPHRGVVEILRTDSDEPAAAGELGRVVVTGLLAREMPLVRYDLGDSAVSTGYQAGCPCGSGWPTIGDVYGRSEDLVKTRDGRRIGLLSHSTLKDLNGIVESQIIQSSFDDFLYRIRLAPGTDRALVENHVRAELTARVGPEVNVRFEYVKAVERTAAGKVQAVKVTF